jgi:Tol biopolymer transport system component
MKPLFLLLVSIQMLSAQIPEGKKVISSLYIYDMIDKESTLITRENRHFEAPNWAANGTYLLINSDGKIEKYSLKGKPQGILDTGGLEKCNNDHGISLDGRTFFFKGGK